MKRFFTAFALLAASLLTFTSCEEEEVTAEITVTSIALDRTEAEMTIGETLITAKAGEKEAYCKVIVKSATDKTITWKSSNEDIVLVSNGSTPAADGSVKPAGTVIAKIQEEPGQAQANNAK